MADIKWQPGIDAVTRSHAVRSAQGKLPFDVLLMGGRLVDVITGEIREADVGLTGAMIASVHPRGSRTDAAEIHQLDGRFIIPGLIDTHVHLESSHMLPHHFAATVVPQGTTTVFWDPHELANVMGVAGVRYAVDASRNLPLRCLCQASSSVPSAPAIESSGSSFGREEMHEMLSWPEVIGVAEMMDMNGVLAESPRMVAIAEEGRAAGKLLEGHGRGLTGQRLQGYVAAGVMADHEITSGEDLLEKLRAGLAIELRGSHDYVMPPVVEALATLPFVSSQIMLCTDDVPPDVLVEKGGMVDVVRRFIRYGMKPVDAIRFATFNAALHLRRDDLGAVCAGRIADIVILADLEAMTITEVYVSGQLAARNGRMIVPIQPPNVPTPAGSMKLEPRTEEDFRLVKKGTQNGRIRFKTIKGVRFSEWSEATVDVHDGYAMLPEGGELNLIYMQHRHGKHSALPQVALQEGLRQLKGAIATTYIHDSHNLFVIGGNPRDMAVAANALIASGGGIAVAQDGKILSIAAFPVAGMISEEPPEAVAKVFAAVRAAAGEVAEWKLPYWIFRTLEGMSLACNPFPHLTDLGLADGKTAEFVEMVLEEL
ncbi:MAG TPA: adenine deaminase C-terminal domain-containing protein [Acidobacteriaceae bacterium]